MPKAPQRPPPHLNTPQINNLAQSFCHGLYRPNHIVNLDDQDFSTSHAFVYVGTVKPSPSNPVPYNIVMYYALDNVRQCGSIQPPVQQLPSGNDLMVVSECSGLGYESMRYAGRKDKEIVLRLAARSGDGMLFLISKEGQRGASEEPASAPVNDVKDYGIEKPGDNMNRTVKRSL